MSKIIINKSYVSGIGKIAFGFGKSRDTETPFISVNNKNRVDKVGADLIGVSFEEEPATIIYFKTLEGLEVLELMVKKVREHLENERASII